MSLQTKLISLFNVLLRVPPLFIIDELFRIDLGLPHRIQGNKKELILNDTFNYEYVNVFSSNYSFAIRCDAQCYKLMFIILLKFMSSCLGCLAALCTFMLLTEQLMVIYMYAFSVLVVFVSYWCNASAMSHVVSLDSTSCVLEDLLSLDVDRILHNAAAQPLLYNAIAQTALCGLFSWVHLGPRYSAIQRTWPLVFLSPTFLALLPLPSAVLHHAPVFAVVLPLAMVKFVLWCSLVPIAQTVRAGYINARNIISNYGLLPLVEFEWVRLSVPTVLRVFWLVRVAEHALALSPTDMLIAGKSLLISGCDTLTAVLGMTSVISSLCHYIGAFFQWVLLVEDGDDKSIGTISAILFYILALQTGLTGLEPEKRFIRLCKNFCLLYTALLHFIHNIVNPLLMSLSASHNPALHRHVRALVVCLFLILYPISLLVYLWANHDMSTWLLAVSAFSLEVIVKVVVSLLIYLLFLIDAYRTSFWEKLDDYVYYIKAFGNTVEFCFGIFLFFNGAWILLFESGGTIRAGMMGVHAYFNIWCEARAGWSVFMRRRTAVNKIESLPEASPAQLASLDDVCAICYQEMRSAKITKCNHFFHGVCLRKWLYIQDRCPMCHDILYKVDGNKEANNDRANNTEVRL